jgi:hypothetical protein
VAYTGNRMFSFCLVLMLFALRGSASAQASSALHLSDYVGTYTDAPGHALEIIAGDELFAVLDEAKYPLHASGVDQFTTITGQTVHFLRAHGNVTGYQQDGKFHPRISATVTPEAAALAYPRPKGQDKDYRYHPPADLHDGIAVGDIAHSGLGTAAADAILRGILDGTYKDVHSVLLYQHGRLVLEEYFYGYSVQRPHQLRSATKSVVATLAGIAVDRGALTASDEVVLPHMNYPSYRVWTAMTIARPRRGVKW